MLMPVETLTELPRNPRRERRLWHDASRHSLSLGCTTCRDRNLCGGLQVGIALFNCLDFCCGNPANCDAVCRNNPHEFARRVWEVDGFSLNNVPRAPVLAAPKLPKLGELSSLLAKAPNQLRGLLVTRLLGSGGLAFAKIALAICSAVAWILTSKKVYAPERN